MVIEKRITNIVIFYPSKSEGYQTQDHLYQVMLNIKDLTIELDRKKNEIIDVLMC